MMAILMLHLAELPAHAALPCRAAALRLSLGGEEGDFNGMSHSGTLVVLRNRGGATCVLPALPRIVMLDRRGRPLPIARAVPPGMHPEPVVSPVTVRPGTAVSTPLRWVSGPVFDRSRCYRPARLTVGGRSVAITANVCGEAGKAARMEQPPLAPLKRVS